MKRNILLQIITLIIITAVFPVYSQQDFDLERKIDSIMNEYNVPGLAVALVNSDSIIFSKSFGYADLKTQKPITENTQFRIASISKSFVSLGIMKLVEEGKLNLETPVKEIIPELEIENSFDEPVRVIHLLEHTAGFDHGRFKEAINFDDDPDISLEEGLKRSPGTRKVRWRPGTRVAYSNHGYAVAGRVIEKITGLDYDVYLKNEILNPIGMKVSSYKLTDEIKSELACGYTENKQEFAYYHMYLRPCGSMHSSLKEMTSFVQFMLNKGKVNGNQLLNESTIRRMQTPESSTIAKSGFNNIGYAKGINSDFYFGNKSFSHNGGIIEFVSFYIYFPESNSGLVILTNCGDFRAYRSICNLLINYLIDENDVNEQESILLSNAELDRFTGFYQLRNTDEVMSELINNTFNTAKVTLRKDTLFMGNNALIPVSENVFKLNDSKIGTIVFAEEDGKMILADLDERMEYARISPIKSYSVIGFLILSIASIITFLIYSIINGLIFIIRKIRKKEINKGLQKVRIFTFISVFSLIVGLIALQQQMSDMFSAIKIGCITPFTVTFFVATIVFALFSLISLVYSIKSFRLNTNKFHRIYLLLTTVIIFMFMLFLAYWDLIGLRTWAF